MFAWLFYYTNLFLHISMLSHLILYFDKEAYFAAGTYIDNCVYTTLHTYIELSLHNPCA